MLKLNSTVALVVVDEGIEEWLIDQKQDFVSNVNTIPEECGTMTNVHAMNVPPHT